MEYQLRVSRWNISCYTGTQLQFDKPYQFIIHARWMDHSTNNKEMFHPVGSNILDSVSNTLCLVVTNHTSGLIELIIEAYVALYATGKYTGREVYHVACRYLSMPYNLSLMHISLPFKRLSRIYMGSKLCHLYVCQMFLASNGARLSARTMLKTKLDICVLQGLMVIIYSNFVLWSDGIIQPFREKSRDTLCINLL